MVLNHIKLISNSVANDFDNNYQKIFEDFSEDIAESQNTLISLINKDEENKLSDADFQSAIFLYNGLTSIIASIELFRRGYLNEPQVILRNVLEIISSAYDIHINPDKYIKYKNHKYDSTNAISVATKIIPHMGQSYGLLSKYVTHISVLHIAPKGNMDKDNPTFWVGGGFKKEHAEYHFSVLTAIRDTLSLLNEFLEIIFYDKLEQHSYIAKDENGDYVINIADSVFEKWKPIGEKMEEFFGDGEENDKS